MDLSSKMVGWAKWNLGSKSAFIAQGSVSLFRKTGTIRSTKYSESKEIIVKYRLKLKKVGKTTRPFRYDLNQITYDYTVELMNRFKGLDLVDVVPEELWMEVCNTVQEVVTKTILKKKKWKKQSSCLRRPYK